MSEIKIIKDFISIVDLKEIAKQSFGDMVKVVVDINRNILALGGELHADEEALLLEQASSQTDLWGFNIYVDQPKDSWFEFNSMVNIRPSQGNKSRFIESEEIRKKIAEIINEMIK